MKSKSEIYPALCGDVLANIYIHAIKQALIDAQIVATALRFDDPRVIASCHQKYTNSLTARFSPEKEKQKLLDWLEGYQLADMCDYLQEDIEAVRKKVRDLVDG